MKTIVQSYTCTQPRIFTDHLVPDDAILRYDEFRAQQLSFYRVLATDDYDTALVYACAAVNASGACVSGGESLSVWSRRAEKPNPDRTRFLLISANVQPCVEVSNFLPLTSQRCDDDAIDVAASRFEACAMTSLASRAAAQLGDAFSLTSLNGSWSSVMTSRTQPQVKSVSMIVQPLDDVTADVKLTYFL